MRILRALAAGATWVVCCAAFPAVLTAASIQSLNHLSLLDTIAALLDRGRFFQLDNRGMAISPPIWTALYTGYPPHDNGVGGFTEWHFRGTTSIVAFLPRFGVHPVWMIDMLLEQFNLFQGWQEIEASTRRIKKPPIWTIASASGRRVGIFSPVPYAMAGERVNGFFVWPGPDDDFNVSRQESVGHATQAVVPLPPEGVAAAGIIDAEERTRVETAMRLFAESKPDLGVYYTHFVDSLSHYNWDFRFPAGWCGGDPAGTLDARFDTTSIARAYLQADAEVLDLIAAFGPSTVILVSDHGWDFNDYEHFLSPNGVLVVANTGAQGYGGVVDLLSVAPTILSLLGVPVAADMQAVIGDLTAGARTADYRGLHQDFIPDKSPLDPNQLELLRSIGYLRGR
ncbi:MAG: alkaline phosphatase family protein [Vicinamibacterales bacterium]